MSALSIAHYFPCPRIRILRQRVSGDAGKAYLEAVPNKLFRPVCHIGGRGADRVHSQERQWVRDLDFGPARVWIRFKYTTGKKLSLRAKSEKIFEISYNLDYIIIEFFSNKY